MNKEEAELMVKKIQDLTMMDFKKNEVRKELTRLYVLLGEIFAISKGKYDNCYNSAAELQALRREFKVTQALK